MAKKLKNDLIYYALSLVMGLTRSVPRSLAVASLGMVGTICFYVIGPARRQTLKNLRKAYGPELTEAERFRLARQVFTDAGKNLADIFRLRNIRSFADIRGIVDIEGLEHLDAAFRRGKGVICLTGHMGAFELLAAYVSLAGYPVQVIGTRLYDKRLDRLLVENRRNAGVENIVRGQDTIKVVKTLKRGGVLGILIDQDTKVESCFVPFFGRPAATPVGAAVLALKTDAAVVPIAIRRMPDNRHRIVVRPSAELVRTGDDQKDAEANTAAWTAEIERFIREAPSQWVWMHRRWRRKPAETR